MRSMSLPLSESPCLRCAMQFSGSGSSSLMRSGMELASRKFYEAVREALSSGKFVVATIMQHRHPFADEIKALPRVEVIEITIQNRDEVPGRIREMIEGEVRRNFKM